MAQGTVSLETAQRCVQLALEIAQAQRLRVAVVVVDRGGHIVAAARMDGVGYLNLEVARRKANAAQNFGAPTHMVIEATSHDPQISVAFQAMADDLIVLPGGFPITEVVTVVGGLGIAGGHYSQDQAVGEKVIAALASGAGL